MDNFTAVYIVIAIITSVIVAILIGLCKTFDTIEDTLRTASMHPEFHVKSLTNELLTTATAGAAGFDLKVSSMEINESHPEYCYATLKLGVCVAIPEGYVGLLLERSSTHKKGISLRNSVGVIDSDYRGELMAKVKIDFLIATIDTEVIGQRLFQLVVVPCITECENVHKLKSTARGEGGFGSTG